MKTSHSTFTKIVLGLLIAGSMASCNKNKAGNTAAPSAPPSADKEPIVYVNSDSLFSKYEYAKDMGKRLNEKGAAAKSEIESKGQALQRDGADYQRIMSSLPADERQKNEQRLQRESQEFQSFQQNASAQFQQEQSAEQGKLLDKITDFTKAYAKEKGYKLVLSYSKATLTVIYGDPSLDVTGDVVKRLNDAYAKEKK
jgi:outer membrane protein